MRYIVNLFFFLSFCWISPAALAALSTADEVAQTQNLEALSIAWGDTGPANTIFTKPEYTAADWEVFFHKFFNCIPSCAGNSTASHVYTDNLDNYLQYPTYYWFDPDLHLKLQTAFVNPLWYKIEDTTSSHSLDLGSAMYNDPELRQTLFKRHTFFTRLALKGELAPRTNTYNKYKSYIAAYPQYFSDGTTVDNLAQPFVAMLRAQVWMNFGDMLIITSTLKNEISTTIGLNGLSGKKLGIWNSSTALIMDNNGLDVAQLGGLYDLLNAIPTNLHNLRYMSVNSFYSSTSWKPLVNKGADGGGINYSLYVEPDSKLSLFFDGAGGTYVKSTASLPSNQWSHVAAVFDGTMVRLYINGIERGSAPSAGLPVSTSTQALTLGRHLDRGNWLKGKLDEWKIFNRALSAAEISSEFNKQTISNSGLAAYFRMDESAGNLVADASGLGNNGTNIGATIVPGQTNNGLSFYGKDSYVQVADSSSLRMPGAFTLEGWVYVVNEFELGATPPTSGAVNTFPDKLNVLEQQFPSDIAVNNPPPIFLSAAAHEINHIVDAYQATLNPTGWWPYKLRLLAQTNRDPMQLLRCEAGYPGCAAYLVDNPQEFFAGMSNQYITDTWHTLDHALQRFNKGYKEPINQFLLFADMYTQALATTKVYTINSTGVVTVNDAAVTRDASRRIVSLRRDDAINHVTYRFTLDTSGNVTAYSTLYDVPTVSPTVVSIIKSTTATLTATVNTNGGVGRAYAQCFTGTGAYTAYGLIPAITLPQQPINGLMVFDITGLTANTPYTCRIGTWNNDFDAVGTPVTFSTLAYPPPVATTGTAGAIARTSATLNGTCNFNGAAGTAVFEYWKSAKVPTFITTATQSFLASSTSYSVAQGITGLSSATNYAFRIKCSNVSGSSTGATSLTFKTAR